MTPHMSRLSMEVYITNALIILGWNNLKSVSTPIRKAIEPGMPLSPALTTKFHTAQGMLGWLNLTCRPDISYAHSRIGQHQATPSDAALEALEYVFRYLKGTKHLCIAAPNYSQDRDLTGPVLNTAEVDRGQHGWEFYCDSDYAGNSEPQNKRRSQNGVLAMLNHAPVYWSSKISSVCFATPDIGEAHADTSSAAAEIFVAGNATKDFLHLSYVAEEANIPFPKPFILQMDNRAAKCFADDSVFKTQLKHIDTRQEWVRMLRDKDICHPVWISTKDNLADIFTKILPVGDFIRLRDQLMHDPMK
jgi:hypothetical protein